MSRCQVPTKRELGADGDAWFETWRMRLPNEHLHHFDRDSLVALLAHHGFECVTLNGFEDGIRLRPGEAGPNILSGFFRKPHAKIRRLRNKGLADSG